MIRDIKVTVRSRMHIIRSSREKALGRITPSPLCPNYQNL